MVLQSPVQGVFIKLRDIGRSGLLYSMLSLVGVLALAQALRHVSPACKPCPARPQILKSAEYRSLNGLGFRV